MNINMVTNQRRIDLILTIVVSNLSHFHLHGFLLPPVLKSKNYFTKYFPSRSPCLFSQTDDSSTISKSQYDKGDFIEHTVSLSKPMGLIIEEVSENNAKQGVQISSINPEGVATWKDVCIGDMILEIDGNNCAQKTFDEVMEILTVSPSEFIQLKLGRPSKAVSVRWPNGVGVASLPGLYLGNVAKVASYNGIKYSCKGGSCGTCEQRMITDGSEDGARYVRPCVARVPSGVSSVVIEPSDRLFN